MSYQRQEEWPSPDTSSFCLVYVVHLFCPAQFDRFQRVMGGESVFEESKIMDNAWRLLKIIPSLKPDAIAAAESDFVQGKKVV
jgi:hypothetical protein